MRDERALRRPGFQDGTAIRLADGQEWVLPAPLESSAAGSASPDLNAEYEAVVAAVVEAQDPSERLLAELCLAIYLLGRNYELAAADYRQLLEFPAGDPGRVALQTALHEVSVNHARALVRRALSVPGVVARRRLLSFSLFAAGH